MVRTVRCPSFAKTYFTPNELSGWEDGIDFGFLAREEEKKKRIKSSLSLLPVVIQTQVLVGQPAKQRSL